MIGVPLQIIWRRITAEICSSAVCVFMTNAVEFCTSCGGHWRTGNVRIVQIHFQTGHSYEVTNW